MSALNAMPILLARAFSLSLNKLAKHAICNHVKIGRGDLSARFPARRAWNIAFKRTKATLFTGAGQALKALESKTRKFPCFAVKVTSHD